MTLNEIENEYGFKYSAIYNQLEQDGMLDVGEYGPEWFSTVFPRLKENPTLLLYSYDFELLSTNAVSKAIQELDDPDDYRQIKPEFRFIPFAQSGAGDLYCFSVNEKKDDDIPVVFVWHDCDEVNYLAKNLQDYIFRALLTDMSYHDTYYNVSDEEFKNNFKRTLKTHTKYLTEKQVGILQNVLLREIIDYNIELPNGRKEKHRGLLTDIELKKTLSETIAFEKLDATLQYYDE
ncbi:SMI1/KNR4 family protein [Chryseobacterium sp. M5]|uniref:SMI1/KNR4 family protein n=1 Tax=Chryseobacterium sp. M5 TaxID=3379128 RepID=UPI003857BB96